LHFKNYHFNKKTKKQNTLCAFVVLIILSWYITYTKYDCKDNAMGMLIPKGNRFFENYDRTFGKKPLKEEINEINENIKEEENKEYITRKEFDEFKSKLFNILLLERSLILNTSRLMDQVAIADERMDKIERDKETLLFDVEMSENNVTNQFESFDKFNEIVKDHLGIKG